MTLAELIAALAAADSRLLLPRGFHKPHSYRGYYEQVAFEPVGDITVADMLAAARSALGATYEGWKGGDYFMGETTVCNVAFEGTTGSGMLADDEITPESLAALLAAGVLSELPERDASEVMSPAPAAYVEAERPGGVIVLEQPTIHAIPVGSGVLKVLVGADVELELTDSDGIEHGMFLTPADARQLAGLLVLAAAEIDADSP